MEPHLPSNTQEQEKRVPTLDSFGLVGLGKPLVEIPNGHSIKGRRKNSGVESAITKFAGANFAKIKPSRGNTNKESVRKTDLSNKFDGVFGSHHSNPNVWGKYPNQLPNNIQGGIDEDNGACDMLVKDRGNAQGKHEVQVKERFHAEDPTEVVILVAVIELLMVKIQPWAPLTAVEQSEEGTEKVY
nr:hypothetical protein CFP56_14215 [Quercus suber]